MKHQKSRLVRAIIIVALLCTGCWFFGRNLKADTNKDLQLGNGSTLVYQVEVASDADADTRTAQVKAAADILAARLKAFGASDCQYTVADTKITFEVTGIDDIDSIRSYLTMTGELTFRKADDTAIMDGSVLNSDFALGIEKSGDYVLGYLYISDTKTFNSYTTVLSISDDTTMVVWIDYTSDQSYSTESKKDQPAYLGANKVDSAISGTTAVMTLSQDYDTAVKLAAVVNSGQLANTVREESCSVLTAQMGENAYNTVFRDIAIGSVAVLLAVILLTRSIGAVSAVYAAFYLILVVFCNSALGVNFNTTSALIILFAMIVSLTGQLMLSQDIKIALRRNCSPVNSFDEGFKGNYARWIDTAVIGTLAGALLWLVGTSSFRYYGITMIISSLLSSLLINFGSAWTINDLLVAGLLDNSAAFGVKKEDIADVAAGENYNYVNRFSKVDFASRDAKGFWPLLLTVIGLAGVVLVIVNNHITAANTDFYRLLIIIAATALVSLIYSIMRCNAASGSIVATMVLLNSILAIGLYGILGLDLNGAGFGLVCAMAGFGGMFGVIIRSAVRKSATKGLPPAIIRLRQD